MLLAPLALAMLAFDGSRAVEPSPSCEESRAGKRFNVFFQAVEIDKLIQTVADATCRTFIVPDTLKGKISILGPEGVRGEVDGERFYAAFLSALDANGFTVLKRGGLYRILEKNKAGHYPVETPTEPDDEHRTNEEMVTRLFKLRYAELEPMRTVLAQLITPGAEIVPYPPDTLILTEQGANLLRIEKIVSVLDVEAQTDATRVIPVKFASAQDLADKIQRTLEKAKAKPVIIADERTNKLIVTASASVIDRVMELLADLDVQLPGDGQVNVYPLKNAEAKEVEATLEPLIQGAHAPAKAPGGGVQSAPLFSGDVKISASEATNALVVVANPSDYRSVSHLIEQLDVPRKQVFIEAAILEVDSQGDDQLGVDFHVVPSPSVPFVIGTNFSGEPSSLSLANLLSASGAVAGIQGPMLTDLSKTLGIQLPQFGILLHALQQVSNVNVVSTPHLLALDNKEAVIHVGQKVPFKTGYPAIPPTTGTTSTAITTAANLYAPITREKIELKLTLKPHVGDGDEVRIDVDEQSEELQPGPSDLGPSTSTRGATTTIVGQNHRTIVLGGIMEDRVLDVTSKIPLLGDLPILGHLFRTTEKKTTKTNLLLFLTPHIIRTREDFDAISRRKREERQRLIERLWGEKDTGEPPIDFERRAGPLAAIQQAIQVEENRPENGGKGNPGEHVIAPAVIPGDAVSRAPLGSASRSPAP